MTELGNVNPDTYIKCPNCGYIFYEIFAEHVDDDGILNCYECGKPVRLPQVMRDQIQKIKKSGKK